MGKSSSNRGTRWVSGGEGGGVEALGGLGLTPPSAGLPFPPSHVGQLYGGDPDLAPTTPLTPSPQTARPETAQQHTVHVVICY